MTIAIYTVAGISKISSIFKSSQNDISNKNDNEKQNSNNIDENTTSEKDKIENILQVIKDKYLEGVEGEKGFADQFEEFLQDGKLNSTKIEGVKDLLEKEFNITSENLTNLNDVELKQKISNQYLLNDFNFDDEIKPRLEINKNADNSKEEFSDNKTLKKNFEVEF